MMNLQIKEGGARQIPSDANGHGVLCSLGSRGHVPTPPGPAIRHGPASTRKAKASCEGRALANSTALTLALFLPVVRGNTALFRGDDHGCSRRRAYARICRGLRPQNGSDQDGISL